MKKNSINYIAKIAVLGAVAAIVMLLEFPLPFAPSFYKLNFSETIVLIAGFALGPVAAVLTELVKILLNLLLNGTTTAGVGEFANFCMGISFVLPAALIYKYKKTFKTALLGMLAGTVASIIVSALVNYYVVIPAYEKFMSFPLDAIIAMGTKVNPNIDSLWTLILFATIPFNLVKGVASSLIAMLLYKRLSPILHKTY